jgi:glycosyltransferase involved in cell wall biosynthesis
MMRITCLVKRWNHHSDSGGYDRLASAMGAKVISRRILNGEKAKIFNKLWNRLSNSHRYLLDYRFEDWLAELDLLARGLVNPPDAVHVLYGDEQLDFLLRWRSLLRCPLVATFHLPAKSTAERFQNFHAAKIRGIDAAIVVARSEVARFTRWFGADRVVFVPHGIDTGRFQPDDHRLSRDKLKVLIVGEHMRDWEVAHRVIDEARHANLDVQFEVVTRPSCFPYLTGCSNTTLHSRIPEDRLIELYQAADVLFLPLTDATANNSLLEGLACGTPVIATDVGGIPDYLSKDSGWLVPRGDAAAPLELIRQLCSNRDIARALRKNARAQAVKFDWREIAERLSLVYFALKAGRSPSAAVKELQNPAVRAGSPG